MGDSQSAGWDRSRRFGGQAEGTAIARCRKPLSNSAADEDDRRTCANERLRRTAQGAVLSAEAVTEDCCERRLPRSPDPPAEGHRDSNVIGVGSRVASHRQDVALPIYISLR